jgi:hypothetical protein
MDFDVTAIRDKPNKRSENDQDKSRKTTVKSGTVAFPRQHSQTLFLGQAYRIWL